MKIPRRHYVRYDGCCKLITKDCGDKCEWYRLTGDIKICGWGKAFKWVRLLSILLLQKIRENVRLETENKTMSLLLNM